MNKEKVLVTGGTGFIASHCILALLNADYNVCTTVRNLSKKEKLIANLKDNNAKSIEKLQFQQADLLDDSGWDEAMNGCTYVLHVASPYPPALPRHEDDLIKPARDGSLRVLKAARDAGVKRVVLTSSFASIGYGHILNGQIFTEESWTDINGSDVNAYTKSKTIAEQAAWDFIKNEGGSLELSVINPVGVLGPVLGSNYSTTIDLVKILLEGSFPALPKITVGIVDVRDVASLHIEAMKNSLAKGERFIATAGDFLSYKEIAEILKKGMGKSGEKVPVKELPNWILYIIALFNKQVALIQGDIGRKRNATGEKASKLLGWQPRSPEEAILATANSLINYGLVKLN